MLPTGIQVVRVQLLKVQLQDNDMNIKDLKPQAHGRHQQGYLDPRSCKKLFPGISNDLITFRSSWERKYAYYCESNPNIKHWGSECIQIPYILYDGTQHTYYPDFLIETVDGTKIVVEIKPSAECRRPINENGYLWNAYTKNMCKWAAAKKFCQDRNMQFRILTEQTINKL